MPVFFPFFSLSWINGKFYIDIYFLFVLNDCYRDFVKKVVSQKEVFVKRYFLFLILGIIFNLNNRMDVF